MTVTRELIPELLDRPHRLGRHIHHDTRSLVYAVPVLPRSAIVSQHWTRRVPVFDQGDLGSCTGNAAAGWVGTDDAVRLGLSVVAGVPVDETFAVDLYGAATKLDTYTGSYPPTDTGSDGLSVAKVLKARGLASAYTHAFTLQALATALQTGPALIGITWYNSQFDPHLDGGIPVDTASGVAGGHELVVDQLEVVDHGDHDRFWVTNSWGTGWSLAGRGYFTGKDLKLLLADDGDVTVPQVAAAPKPPAPVPPSDVDAALWAASLVWARVKGYVT